MSNIRDPPTMNEFPQVYVEALNILQTKINNEEESIKIFQENNDKLNNLVKSEVPNPSENHRQFVFRVNQIEGIFNRNPVLKMNFGNNEVVEIDFNQFEEGDVIVTLPAFLHTIKVQVFSDDGTYQFEFDIELDRFEDKRRQQNDIKIQGQNGADIAVEYEGQIINNQVDYKKGLMYLNGSKIEQAKFDKYNYSKFRDDLLDIFKDQNLSASVLGNNLLRQSFNEPGSQFEVMGNVPVLKSNPLASSFAPNEIKTRESTIGFDQKKSPMEMGIYNSDIKKQSRFAQYLPPNTLDWSYFVHILFYVNFGLLLVSFFVNWDRASFLSIFMAILYITWYFLKEEYDSLLPPVFLVVGYLMAFGLDLSWLILSSKGLWNSTNYIHDGSLNGMNKFMIIMSYVIIFIEMAAALISGYLVWKGMFTQTANPPKQPLVMKLF